MKMHGECWLHGNFMGNYSADLLGPEKSMPPESCCEIAGIIAGKSSNSIFGFNFAKCRFGGVTPRLDW